MDHKLVIQTVVGHLSRLLLPAVLWIAGKFGVSLLDAEAADIAGALAALVGVVASVTWSVKSRAKLRAQQPPSSAG